MDTFVEFFKRATDNDPYGWQSQLADQGLPELIDAETGTGKTEAVLLAWLFRRRFHPDPEVRRSTPRWILFVEPMRVLVEQAVMRVERWLDTEHLNLTQDDLGLYTLMGGEGKGDTSWRDRPGDDAIFIGTFDMLMSRALNRGYGASRWVWPIDFGLFNSGCHWVYDEVQLMGPALETSRQLEGFRRSFGTALPARSTWMSATVDHRRLATVDCPSIESVVSISDADRMGGLGRRLKATREVRRLGNGAPMAPEAVAEALVREHRPGTLTLAVMNTVTAAREVHKKIRAQSPIAEVVLLHSRFRPGDRKRQVEQAIEKVDPEGPGRIVVSTQVVEAGVDISAAVLFTEAAPWPSIVQRAGRCNRDGLTSNALLLWAPPLKDLPYLEADVQASTEALAELEGQSVTSSVLRDTAVAVTVEQVAMIRRRDLLGLFDTTPDLAGNDLDIAPFLRNADDLDVQVFWRDIPASERQPKLEGSPTRHELCPVPLGELRDELKKKKRTGFVYDHLDAGWRPVDVKALRPGQIIALRASEGGYDEALGWDASSKGAVTPFTADVEPSEIDEVDEAVGDDPVSYVTKRWVRLVDHLADVEAEVKQVASELAPDGFAANELSPEQVEAAIVAGGLHDIGKIHEIFQTSMQGAAKSEAEKTIAAEGGPWAKSILGASPYQRPYFRHELASALALLGDASALLDGVVERDVAVYLIAAHHGRVRLGIRSLPKEKGESALGIQDGDTLPGIELARGMLPPVRLDLSPRALGDTPDGQPSWSHMALQLRDRADLGPFRLAFLEALVRLSDWRASASVDIPEEQA